MGDIFNWNAEESNWELSNVVKIELDTSDFCVDFPDKNYYMLPERRSLESGDAACNIMGNEWWGKRPKKYRGNSRSGTGCFFIGRPGAKNFTKFSAMPDFGTPTYFFKKFEFILGGSVSIPLGKSENDKIQEIGDNFYQTCEANEQSGKTLWIGIERSIGDFWVVST